MPAILIAFGRARMAAALILLSLSVEPMQAQVSGANDPLNVSSGYAFELARYYAPYALQAAAAYIPATQFDKARRQSASATWDQSVTIASDVLLAVSPYSSDRVIQSRAAKYLQAWRYQFGRTGYLDCYENNSACRQKLAADRRGRKKIAEGPSFHVWARYDPDQWVTCSEVSVAFRGTDVRRTYSDHVANFRSINPANWFLDDHYRQLRRNVDAIIDKITGLPCYKRANGAAQIVSVGHSLGGGLAEFAALANNSPTGARIVKVFSFNASPETGSDLIDPGVLKKNAERLEIDRVYQQKEINTRLRLVYEDFPPSSMRCKPQVRNIQHGVFQSGSTFDVHSIEGLAGEMVRTAHRGAKPLDYLTPRKTSCETDYKAPASDEYEAPARNLAPETGPSDDLQATTVALVNRRAPVRSTLRTDSFETAPVSAQAPVWGVLTETAGARNKRAAALRVRPVPAETHALLRRD